MFQNNLFLIAVVSCMLRYKSFLSDVNGLWLSCLNFWLSSLSTLGATNEGYSNKYSSGTGTAYPSGASKCTLGI
jgi:hypothetical protein